MPKHIHKGLVHKGKGCRSWFEDSCPQTKAAWNATSQNELDSLGYSIFEEWGDDRSVALAEALVELIDGAGGEGTSNTLGWMLSIVALGVFALCLLRERRAAERRKRFEAFMAEEAESLHEGSSVQTPGRWSLGSPHCRKLGPSWSESAVSPQAWLPGSKTPSAAQKPFSEESQHTISSALAIGSSMCAHSDDEEKLRKSVRDAARRDIEERKERRRIAAEEARVEALREERATAEEHVRAQLNAKAQEIRPEDAAPARTTCGLPSLTDTIARGFQNESKLPTNGQPSKMVSAATMQTTGGDTPALPAGAPVSSTQGKPEASKPAISLVRAEAEFLDALNDL